LVWGLAVAAQPATARTAISIKIRFIAILVAFPDLSPGLAVFALRMKRFEAPVLKKSISGTGLRA
jgi:hypothetical protein